MQASESYHLPRTTWYNAAHRSARNGAFARPPGRREIGQPHCGHRMRCCNMRDPNGNPIDGLLILAQTVGNDTAFGKIEEPLHQ